ncbi:MFS transporter [Paraburkholderia bannensis]|uniref:MFS transporter n=1 Tax=Paraburkholderia bannensis TaxID=765414 RepID=UPI002AB1EB04|nr:MFS transporter [Paraburkholderia bannensis]
MQSSTPVAGARESSTPHDSVDTRRATAQAAHLSPEAHARQISARLDRLPPSAPVWLLIGALALGGWFEIYDMFLTAYIGPGLVKAGIFARTTASVFDFGGLGAFVAALFLGLFIGTIGVAFIADRLGRRRVFVGALLCYTFAAVMMSLQSEPGWVVFWRVVAGIGVGAELVTIDAYVSEFVPARLRGRAFAFVQAIQYTSIPTIAFLSWQLVPIAPFGQDGWRWVVWIGCSGAVFVWLIRLGLPESPRWLIQHGRTAEAEAIVARLEKRIERATGKPLPAAKVAPATEAAPATASADDSPWSARYRRRTIMLLVFNFFQSIGYYGFASWVPTLLAEKGVTLTHSLWYSFLIAIASPLGPLFSMLIADRVERKWLIVGSATAMAVLGIVFAQQRVPLLLVAMGLLMTLAGNCMTFSYRTYQAELFPTRMRARAIGLVYSASRISAMLSGFLIAFFLRHLGVGGVFSLIAGSMFIVVLTIGLFGPRSRGLSLEQISA